MSWLEHPPCKMVSALNTINAAIIERYNYMYPSSSTDYSWFNFLSTPCDRYNVWEKMRDTVNNLRNLYKGHFPVKSFGRWSDRWNPYEYTSGPELEAAIVAELSEVGIDPGAFFMKNNPRRRSDVNFIRACYHLINNVLLYNLEGFAVAGQHIHRGWRSEEAYDNNDPSVDEIVDGTTGSGLGGEPAAAAMVGYYKSSLESDFNIHFLQRHVDFTWGHVNAPELQGNWKARYTVRIYKQLNRPRESNVQVHEESYYIPGSKEVNFSGSKSEIIPYTDDITRDLSYYQTWGNYKYGYAVSFQVNKMSEVFLTPENFPAPNYKYID